MTIPLPCIYISKYCIYDISVLQQIVSPLHSMLCCRNAIEMLYKIELLYNSSQEPSRGAQC